MIFRFWYSVGLISNPNWAALTDVAPHPKTPHKVAILAQDNSARLVDLRCDMAQSRDFKYLPKTHDIFE